MATFTLDIRPPKSFILDYDYSLKIFALICHKFIGVSLEKDAIYIKLFGQR